MSNMAIEAVIALFPSERLLQTVASHDSATHVAQLFCAARLCSEQTVRHRPLTTLLPALVQSGLNSVGQSPEGTVQPR